MKNDKKENNKKNYTLALVRPLYKVWPIYMDGRYRNDLVRLYYITNYKGRRISISDVLYSMIMEKIHEDFPDIPDSDLKIWRIRTGPEMAKEISTTDYGKWTRRFAVHVVVPRYRWESIKSKYDELLDELLS